jgi:hypothetical protein
MAKFMVSVLAGVALDSWMASLKVHGELQVPSGMSSAVSAVESTVKMSGPVVFTSKDHWPANLPRALCVVTPPSFGSPATSKKRSLGFAPPPHSRFAFLAAPRCQYAASAPYSYWREDYVRSRT